jgi:sugar (pentulose or hexulose) kinase
MEPSHVSAFGGLDLETGQWDTQFLDRLGLSRLQFPLVRPVETRVGEYESGGRKIPCTVSVGDQQAALTGALLRPGELSINASTGSQVALISPGLEYGDHQVRPYFDGRFLKIITHIPAGRSLTALANLLSEVARANQPQVDAWSYLTRAAEQAAGTDLRVDLSFYASTTGTSGSIGNIREDNLTAGHLFRAAYENMAENFFTQALRLSPGRDWRRLVFSGGLVQKIPLLHRLIVERFGNPGAPAPSRMSPTPEDSLTGLLALALVCSGEAGSVREAVERLARAYSLQPIR